MKLASFALAASISIASAAEKAPTRQRTLLKRHTSNLQRQRAAQEEELTTPTMTSSLSMSMSLDMSVDMCTFCPGGLVNPEFVIMTEDQVTCSMAQEYASTFEASNPTCAMILKVEAQCCPPTIYDLGSSEYNFSTLIAAFDAAGLAGILQGPGPLALFAPTNNAFAALPAEYTSSLFLPKNAKLLQSILLYHLVAVIPIPSEAGTLNGATVTVAITETGGMVNDANIIAAPVVASNGAIYIIDKVLLPPPTEDTPPPVPAWTDVANSCSFCPVGLVNPDLVFSQLNPFTCADAIDYALTLTPDDSDCENIKGAEFLCCPAYLLYHYNIVVPKLGDFTRDEVLLPPPTEDTPPPVPAGTDVAMCSFCPVGLVNPDLVFSQPNAFTCADAVNYALTLTRDNSDCENMKGAEFLCCPAYLLYHYNIVVPKLGEFTRNSYSVSLF